MRSCTPCIALWIDFDIDVTTAGVGVCMFPNGDDSEGIASIVTRSHSRVISDEQEHVTLDDCKWYMK